MNIFQAIGSVFSLVFLEGRRAAEEREQQGPEGRAYDKWLGEHGYEAQYQAYMKAHGTNNGFVYKDPGNPPSFTKEGS